MNELVSIIVPVYNKKQTLKRCVESIACQSYKNIEIILVDDGSNDGSDQLCMAFANENSKVRLVRQDNGGVSSARNKGISIAKGTHIQFVDADDSLQINMTEKLVEKTIEFNCDLVICGYNKIVCDFQGQEVKTMSLINMPNGSYTKKIFAESFAEAQYGRLMGWEMVWDKLYRRDIILTHKLSFKEGLSYGEDCDFNFRYIDYCHKIGIIKDCLYNYYIYNYSSGIESLSTGFKNNLFELQNNIYEEFKSFLVRNDLFMPNVQVGYYHNYINETIKAIYRYCRNDSNLKYMEKIKTLSYIMKYPLVVEGLYFFKPRNKKESRAMPFIMKSKQAVLLELFCKYKVRKIYGGK